MDNFSISGRVGGCKGFGLHNLDNGVHEIFAGSNFCEFCDSSSHPQRYVATKIILGQTFFPQTFTL